MAAGCFGVRLEDKRQEQETYNRRMERVLTQISRTWRETFSQELLKQ